MRAVRAATLAMGQARRGAAVGHVTLVDPGDRRIAPFAGILERGLLLVAHPNLTRHAAAGRPRLRRDRAVVVAVERLGAGARIVRTIMIEKKVPANESHRCEVIALGCNEVPRSGGGTYWNGKEDQRDYAIGYDSNQKVRDDMARDALVRLQDKKWLSSELENLTQDELVARAFDKGGSNDPPLKDAMLRDVIEYGRMVHAEMNALSDAARFGRPTKGATLYCTTMPCHRCAKLIVAAGIKRVVYVQPYTKSLVEELYFDSIAIDDMSPGSKVRFESLKGVTPNGFRIAFRKTKRRKDSHGKALEWDATKAKPIFLSGFAYYQPLEGRAVIEFQVAIENVKALHPEQKTLPLVAGGNRGSKAAKPKPSSKNVRRGRSRSPKKGQ